MNMATKWKRQLLVADCGKILSGDRISLPGTVLQELEHLIVEGQSLFLKISASQAKGARSLVASVGDFNADANMVTLPVWMQQHLGVSVNGQVLISVVDEPEKAESCALQPLDARFLKIENHKAALESALSSQFNTLNEGTTIAIKHQNQLYAMHVSQLQPESCCSIMNTELIVDLIPPLGPDGKPIFIPKGSNAHKSIKKQETIEIPFGEAEGIVCKLRNSGYTIFKTMVPNITSFKVHMKTTEKSPVGADFEAYAADDSIETPEREKHQFSSTGENIESSEITITTQKNCSGRFFYVGARAYECETCEVKVAIMPEQTTSSSTDQSTQQNMIACQNCKELIPQGRIQLHAAYCERHNVFCSICKKTVRKIDWENHWHCPNCTDQPYTCSSKRARKKHNDIYHTPISCDCGTQFELVSFLRHKREDCENRTITCRFCYNSMKAGPVAADPADRIRGYTEHEAYCGSKTEPCSVCGRSIRLRDLKTHSQLHDLDTNKNMKSEYLPPTDEEREAAWAAAGYAPSEPLKTPKPINRKRSIMASMSPNPKPIVESHKPAVVCRNVPCSMPLASPSPSLCAICWGKVGGPYFKDTSRNLDTQTFIKALLQLYVKQLTTGCGDSNCQNVYCVSSGKRNTVTSTVAATTALHLLKNGLESEHHICVSPEQRTHHNNVEMLASMGFKREWAVTALSERQYNMEDSVAWLCTIQEAAVS
eukprot:m.91317 g.91317  ORF g.91317 m.91317 type:complete len:711 (-) comp13300_c0_seq4:201-2333(-)